MLKNVGHAAKAKYSLAEKNKVQIKQKEYVQQNVSHLKEETIYSHITMKIINADMREKYWKTFIKKNEKSKWLVKKAERRDLHMTLDEVIKLCKLWEFYRLPWFIITDIKNYV